MAKVEFNKKRNTRNEENLGKAETERSSREIKVNVKNISQMVMKEGGITVKDGKNDKIDFTQEYFKKNSKLNNSKSGYLSSRNYR